MTLVCEHASSQRYFSIGFEFPWPSSDVFPGSCCSSSRVGALSNQVTLKLGESTHKMEDELASWSGGIDLFDEAEEPDGIVQGFVQNWAIWLRKLAQ